MTSSERMSRGVLLVAMALLPWLGVAQGWLGVDLGQSLRNDWAWGMSTQIRSESAALGFNEVVSDASVRRTFDAVDGLAVDGQWRTGWEAPLEGGLLTSWRWATSVRYKHKVGDDALVFRVRHQWGGPWMRAWDNARWRTQLRWVHDLPKGWKAIPSLEGFFRMAEGGSQALRARIVLDKKLSKRRHISCGAQWQTSPSGPSTTTVLCTYDWTLKKPKKPQGDEPK